MDDPANVETLTKRLQQAESLLRRAIEMRAAQRYYYRTLTPEALSNARRKEREFEAHSEKYAKTWTLLQMRLHL